MSEPLPSFVFHSGKVALLVISLIALSGSLHPRAGTFPQSLISSPKLTWPISCTEGGEEGRIIIIRC